MGLWFVGVRVHEGWLGVRVRVGFRVRARVRVRAIGLRPHHREHE